jgi:hypothetical protein
MKEFAPRTGEFRGWTEPARRKLFRSCTAIMKRHIQFGYGFEVAKSDFQQIVVPYARPDSPFRDPYWWCVKVMMEGLAHSRRLGLTTAPVALIIDQGSAKQHIVDYYLNGMREYVDGWDEIFGSVTFAKNVHTPPLQAADILAYEVRKHAVNVEYRGEKKARETFELLARAVRTDVACHRKPALLKLVADWNVKGQPL